MRETGHNAMSALRAWLGRDKGATSVAELMVTSVILIALLVSAYALYESSWASWFDADRQMAGQGDARRAMWQMTRSIRMIESFVQAGDYEVEVTEDVDDDEIWDQVRFYLSGDSLYYKLNDGEPQELAANVINQTDSTPLFVYIDPSGDIISDLDERKTNRYRVRISLVVDENTSRPPAPYRLTSDVQLRNYD